jgi:hypothetical protein
MKHAVELAATCEHKEAQLLTRICAGKTLNTREEARLVFLEFAVLAEEAGDETSLPSALCFVALLSYARDEALLRRAGALGSGFAYGILATWTVGEERFAFASESALRGERDGFFWLGNSYQFGNGCQADLNRARMFCCSGIGRSRSVSASGRDGEERLGPSAMGLLGPSCEIGTLQRLLVEL